MRKFLPVLSLGMLCSLFSYSQDFSNKGKEFWLAYSYHVGMVNGGGAPAMTLNITSDVTTTFTVEIWGGPIISTATIVANTVTNVTIPNTYFINADGLFNGKAVHVTAVQPIVVYSFITRSAASAATLCLPTNVLGKQYYAMSFTQLSNEANASSYITIVAVEDNTSVEIIPTAATKGGWVANSINTINLNKGQVYQVLGTTTGNTGVDLSGSSVKSIASGTGGCKRIAVFSGSGKLALGCSGGSADNLYQQLYPAATWGKKYLTVPSYSRNNNYFRIMRTDPATNVTLNGVPIPAASFTAAGYYQFSNTIPNAIVSDLPISVTQYFTSQNCLTNGSPYDPDMIVLSPVEQNIKKVTLVSSNLLAGTAAQHQHHLHVIMRNTGTAITSFRFDGAPIPATTSWVVHPNDANYSYLYLPLVSEATPHSLSSDSGFNALAYGYANAETYGYSAGTNVKDLYQQISVTTQYGIETSPSVCSNSPFKFKISLPYQPLQLLWTLTGLPAGTTPNNTNVTQVPVATCPTTTTAVCYDSTTFVNGKQIWWYSLPTFYSIPAIGIYPITLTAQTSGVDGCGSEQVINFDLEVSNPPMADFTFNAPGCVAEPVQFQDATITVKPNYSWYWNFDDPGSGAANISNLRNPIHTFSTPGTHTVRFASITTPGCLSDTLPKPVFVPAQPSATIAGTIAVCQNATQPTITFTAADGTAPYTFTYNINNGPAQTIVTTGTSLTATVAAPTTTTGTFIYTLTNVQNPNSTFCTTSLTGQSATVTVNPLPTATISGTTALCQNSPSPNIVFTGANALAPYTFSYTINSGPVMTVTTTSGNSVNVPVPTATTGTFIYDLVSVTDASSTLCSQTATGSATVVVQAASTATIAGDATICQNATAPQITFTAANGIAPFTFTYNINNGPSQTISTAATSNSVTLPVPMIATGTFVYNLTGVSTTGPVLCFTPITGSSVTVIINPVPTATISGTTTVCQNSPAQIITFTGANALAPYTFSYTINSGPVQTISTTSGNSVTISVATTVPGSFAYSLVSVTDASSTLCTQPQTGTATVTVNQLASATISGTTELCLNAPQPNINFSATGGLAPYTFTYQLNSGPNQTITTVTGNSVTLPVSTAAAGTFVYTLLSVQESSALNCVQTQTGTATVIIDPQPTAGFTTNTPLCEIKDVTFTPTFGVSSGTVVSWLWNYGDGTGPQVRTNGNPFIVNYATAGPKNVTFQTVSDKGCLSPVFAQVITINARPVAGFISPEICLLDPFAQFTDTSSVAPPGTITAWQWNFGDINSTPGNPNTSNAQNPTHIYTVIGNYNIEQIVTSNFGCKDTIPQVITISDGNPMANFIVLNSANLCSNDSVSIQNKSTIGSGLITKLEIYWDNVNQPGVFDLDNVPVFDKIYKHKYPTLTTPQNYTIQMRAYSGGLCFSTKQVVVTVHASPVVQLNAIPDVCLNNGTVQFTQGSETAGVTGTGVYSGNGVSPGGLFNPLTAGVGIHVITYTFTSNFGCTEFKTTNVKVLAAPVAIFATSGFTCQNNLITFTESSTPGTGTLNQWTYNWGDMSPVQVFTTGGPRTHTYSGTGPITATLTVMNSDGCKSTTTPLNFTVNPQPQPDFTFTPVACLPQALINFTNTTTPNVGNWNYAWNFDLPSTAPGDLSTGVNPSHTYTSVGPHNVQLVATSNTGTGCTNVIVKPVNSIHPAPLASFSVNQATICVDKTIKVTDASSFADGTPSAWSWNYGDNTPLGTGQIQPAHTYTAEGNYTIKLTITNSFGCTDDTTRPLIVYPYPVISAGPDQIVLQGGTIVLPATATGNDLVYLWTPATYLNSTTVLQPTVQPYEDVTYTLLVTARGGCSKTDMVFVEVLKAPVIPNTFTPNNDGVHDFWEIKYLFQYPGNRVQVFTRTGALVFESRGYAKPWNGTKNGQPLPFDTYYYIIEPNNGRKPFTGYVTIIK